jgi:hypothetical protein
MCSTVSSFSCAFWFAVCQCLPSETSEWAAWGCEHVCIQGYHCIGREACAYILFISDLWTKCVECVPLYILFDASHVAKSGRLIWYLLPLKTNFVGAIWHVWYLSLVEFSKIWWHWIVNPWFIEAVLFSYADTLSYFSCRLERIWHLKWAVQLLHVKLSFGSLLLPIRRKFVILVWPIY